MCVVSGMFLTAEKLSNAKRCVRVVSLAIQHVKVMSRGVVRGVVWGMVSNVIRRDYISFVYYRKI